MDLYRQVAAAQPDAFLPDLGASLNNLGYRLSDVGRREEVLAASQEAVDILRRLVAARPDAFLSDLAISLGILSQVLAGLQRASDAAGEGLELLAALVEAQSQAFGELARNLCRDYVMHSRTASLAPDTAFLAREESAGRTGRVIAA